MERRRWRPPARFAACLSGWADRGGSRGAGPPPPLVEIDRLVGIVRIDSSVFELVSSSKALRPCGREEPLQIVRPSVDPNSNIFVILPTICPPAKQILGEASNFFV